MTGDSLPDQGVCTCVAPATYAAPFGPRVDVANCAVHGFAAVQAERDRLRAENEALKAAIRKHRENIRAIYNAETPTEPDALLWRSVETDEQHVSGVSAATTIKSRSWDPKDAGRRAVEKHGDALARLSDEQEASDA